MTEKNKFKKSTSTLTYRELLEVANQEIYNLIGENLDLISIAKPDNINMAIEFSKIISKLSPILGNLIEFKVIEILNQEKWEDLGVWKRQDPGFPDAIFKSDYIFPNPGIEVKTWFPLSTEITARFKDSVKHFVDDQIDVAILVWLPEFVFWGKPKIVDICIISAGSVAAARDKHYHKPPHYLVFEPEDTSSRTVNLQQTNTNGYVMQNKSEFKEALLLMTKYGEDWNKYDTSEKYQSFLRKILSTYSYRLDTNYAKLDRIQHEEINKFKIKVLDTIYQGRTIKEWAAITKVKSEKELIKALEEII